MTIRPAARTASLPSPRSRRARRIAGWSFALALAAAAPARAEAASFEPRLAARQTDSVIRVEVPSAALAAGAQRTPEFRERVDRLVRTVTTDVDLIVVLVDEQGTPLWPDFEASRSIAAGAEPTLQFTFRSPLQPWTPDELATLTGYLADILPAIHSVYGPPAFSITVNVSRDSTVTTAAGLYYPYYNEVVLKRLSPSTLCHEVIHAFRDDAVLGIAAYEEGMTMAATIAVLNRFPYDYSDKYHGSSTDVNYELLNLPAAETLDGNILVAPGRALLRYHLAGYAWGKLHLEDASFFSEFNRRYLERFALDPSVRYSEAELTGIAASIRPTCEGTDFTTWRSGQHALGLHPSPGLFVYQRGFEPSGSTTVDVFERQAWGEETPQAGGLVSWQAHTHDGTWSNAGTVLTTPAGTATFSPSLPLGYTGRVRIITSFTGAAGPVTSETIRYAGSSAPQGVFGTYSESDSGTVVLTPLDPLSAPFEVELVNGAFEAPGLQSVSGRIRLDLWSGGYVGSRTITKDASAYCVLLTPGNLERVEGAGIRLEAWPSVTRSGTYLHLSAPLPTAADLVVVDVAGRVLQRITLAAGRDGAQWDGTGGTGHAVPPGLYFVRLTDSGAGAHVRVVVL